MDSRFVCPEFVKDPNVTRDAIKMFMSGKRHS